MTGTEDDQPTEDTRTDAERYEAGAARARAQYEGKPKLGSIPLLSRLSPITPPTATKES